MKTGFMHGLMICLAFAALTVYPASAHAEYLSRQQLSSVMLDQSDLQGFYRRQLQTLKPSQTKDGEDSDFVLLNQNVTQYALGRLATPYRSGTINYIRRIFVSNDRVHELDIEITLCDSPEDARDEVANLRKGAQAVYSPGSLTGGPQIGDASWYAVKNTLLLVCGKMIILVSGDTVPASVIEATAYQALLHASEQPNITGVFAKMYNITVNSHDLPEKASRVAGRTYVLATEFAKAMGLTNHWDMKTGVLTLSGTGHKPVILTASSTVATIGSVKAAALSVPVLKQAGQPLMTLDDLLTVTGAKITGHSGNTLLVKS